MNLRNQSPSSLGSDSSLSVFNLRFGRLWFASILLRSECLMKNFRNRTLDLGLGQLEEDFNIFYWEVKAPPPPEATSGAAEEIPDGGSSTSLIF